jgi:hypothetical protein
VYPLRSKSVARTHARTHTYAEEGRARTQPSAALVPVLTSTRARSLASRCRGPPLHPPRRRRRRRRRRCRSRSRSRDIQAPGSRGLRGPGVAAPRRRRARGGRGPLTARRVHQELRPTAVKTVGDESARARALPHGRVHSYVCAYLDGVGGGVAAAAASRCGASDSAPGRRARRRRRPRRFNGRGLSASTPPPRLICRRPPAAAVVASTRLGIPDSGPATDSPSSPRGRCAPVSVARPDRNIARYNLKTREASRPSSVSLARTAAKADLTPSAEATSMGEARPWPHSWCAPEPRS